jgi:tyrosinase
MSSVDLSARDPIFFLHHANIDRLWATWNARGNANSPEAMWRGFSFARNFVNPDGSSWTVGVGELGSPPALGYRYDDGNDPFAADVVLAAGDPMLEKLRAYRQLESRGIVGGSTGVQRIELQGVGSIYVRDRPIAISVPLGRQLGDIVGQQAFAMQPDRPQDKGQRRYVWAFLHDVVSPLDVTTRVQVFCNCRDLNSRTQLNDPSYLTGVSFFGSEHASHSNGNVVSRSAGISACVDLTPALSRLDRPRSLRTDRLSVQLLPNCENTEANVSNVRPRRVEVVIL